ncbi:MAG: hypothetical protein FWF11_04025 [Coriobacteriia bacterium]|nr:hypothetical protein [Coriobacteriia bacterium]
MGKKTARLVVVTIFVVSCFLSALPAQAVPVAPVDVTIPVEQVFEMPDTALSPGEFDYIFTAKNPANPMPAGAVGDTYNFSLQKSMVSGIGPITFTESGFYHYELRCNITSRPGYVYSEHIYDITVVIRTTETEPGVFALTAEIRILQRATEAKVDTALFDKSYSFQATDPNDMIEVDPPVVKTVQGNPANNYIFRFRMTAADPSQPMPPGSSNGVKEVIVIGSGETEFGIWAYTQAGIFTYTITEIDSGNPDYIFDRVVYTIVDTVTDVNGKLVLNRVVTNQENRQVESLSFVNTYIGDSNQQDPPGGGLVNRPPGEGPKTGDYADPMQLILVMVGSALIALLTTFLIYIDRRGEKEHAVPAIA